MKRILLKAFILFLALPNAICQSPHQQLLDDREGNTFYLMSDLLPQRQISLLTGQYSLGLFNDGPKYNEIIKSEQDNLLEIDANKVYGELKDKNC